MEFNENLVFTSLNADKLSPGDNVIVADTMQGLKYKVKANEGIDTLYGITDEGEEKRFLIRIDCINKASAATSWLLAYLVERKENCTNCRLCNGSIKDDPTEVCENYEPQVEPPANCETCSKADTARCPVPNPPKETGCCHWESMPARVCENCRNLECHGKDNNWCEIREIKLSDEAIKKNTCGYLKLVKAEKHYRPFKDTDELVKVWCEHKCPAHNHRERGLTMPLIWVREKGCEKSADLITCYGSKGITVRGEGMYFDTLFTMFEFLDGSPCGVEE